jgi:nucleotide-binding universal stress UspA family protein
MLSVRNILVPTDFSNYADKALDLAVDIAKRNKAKITLLHVIDPVQQCVADYCLPDEVVRSIMDKSVSETKANFRKEAERFGKDGVQIVPDIKEGVPYVEILNEQKDKRSDLIVMSAHGRTGLKKYFIGSVTDRVVNAAPCDVVVVKS